MINPQDQKALGNAETPWVVLPQGRSLTLHRAIGQAIEMGCGLVWLTEPGRPGDVFLRRGQRWTLGSDDRVVLTAWQPSWLRLHGSAA